MTIEPDTKAAALEWIAQRCMQAQTPADFEAACTQCAKLAREVLNDELNRRSSK